MKIINQYCIYFLFFIIVVWTSDSYAKKLYVVASTSNLASLAEEIGKDKLKITTIAKPTEDPHFVDARPSFIAKLNKADLLIAVGLQLEIGWLPNLVLGARNNTILPGNIGYLVASSGIRALEVPDPSQVNRSLGDVHPLGNPHFSLDPLNGKLSATNICERLCQIDSENCNYYTGNLQDFTTRLEKKLSEWKKKLEPFRGTKIVTYHKTFTYFANRFHLDVVGTLEPKPGIPPSPVHINSLIPMMREKKVHLIIIEQFREKRTPEFVSSKTGAKVVVLPIMVEGERGINNYIDLFDYNINKIIAALKTTAE